MRPIILNACSMHLSHAHIYVNENADVMQPSNQPIYPSVLFLPIFPIHDLEFRL